MIYLAPMQGLTEVLFRKAHYKVFGNAIDVAVSPFVSLTHGDLSLAHKKIKDILPETNNNSIAVVPQILGREIPEFIDLANRLYQIGYTEINWNIGCPVSKVAHKKRGSGILPYPADVENILSKVIPNISAALSIKMRLGYETPTDIDRLIPILNNFPLKSITIHPRIGTQMYDGELDLDTFANSIAKLNHHIIFNGDIKTLHHYKHICRMFPSISDVMIGRGILANPLLASEIKGHSFENKQSVYLDFVRSLFEEIEHNPMPEISKMRKTKEYWQYFSQHFVLDNSDIRKVLLSETLAETQNNILTILSDPTVGALHCL